MSTQGIRATHFIDTCILLYSISSDQREQSKRRTAEYLLGHDDVALSVQVLQEFYLESTRPSRVCPLPGKLAAGLVETWTRFTVQEINVLVMRQALSIRAALGLSYRDSGIVAAACALGCREIWTEDLAHGRQIEGVLIVNPFR